MEGARTEPIYFGALRPGRDAAVRLVLVSSKGHKSNPKEVLARLQDWARKNGLRKGDEGWLIIDRDEFSELELDAVCAEAARCGYHVAMSNPCFELWLWLHVRENRPFLGSTHCQKELGKILPDYSKGKYDPEALLKIGGHLAIKRASALDLNPDEAWPRVQSTRVYRLCQRIFPHLFP